MSFDEQRWAEAVAHAKQRTYARQLDDAYARGEWAAQVRPNDPALAAIYDRKAAIYDPIQP